MTADMAFESLIVSHDAKVFPIMDRLLRQLSVTTSVCLSASKALDHLRQGSTDLLVLDCEQEDWRDLLCSVWSVGWMKKPTVMALTPTESRVASAHVVLKKPITHESASRSLKSAYTRMIHDYRSHVRHAVMAQVSATLDDCRDLRLTITDIGEGGVGIASKEQLPVGSSLRFRLRLPEMPREILLGSRILWAREYGRYGCEFTRVPPVDYDILRDWMKSRLKVKKPLVNL